MKSLIFFLLPIIFFASAGLAQNCMDYGNLSEPFYWLGEIATDQSAYDVAILGSYAYVAASYSGLQVVDISDPENPQLIGSLVTPDAAVDIVVAGDYAYIAANEAGLLVVNISNPESPWIEGVLNTSSLAVGIVVSGNYAYVADAWSGLYVINISNPSNPEISATDELVYFATGIDISDQFLFITDSGVGLLVVDIADPENPLMVGTLDTLGYPYSVTVSGGHAFVACGRSGLQIADIFNPALPFIVGGYTPGGNIMDVSVLGSSAFVVGGTGIGIQEVDISDLARPQIIRSLPMEYTTYGVECTDTQVFAAAGASGLHIYEGPVPGEDPFIGRYGQGFIVEDVAIAGTQAYLIDNYGLNVIDVSNPAEPQFVKFVRVATNAVEIASSGLYAYVVGGWQTSLQVVDFQNINLPRLRGSIETPGDVFGVAFSGSYAYINDSIWGLLVIDISDPNNLVIAGGIYEAGSGHDVAISGTHAFVADTQFGLQVIDVSNPEDPQFVTSVGAPCRAIDIEGNFAFATGLSGFQVFDITNPASAQLIVSLPEAGEDLDVSGTFAYVSNTTGVRVVDILDPWNPEVVGNFEFPGDAKGIAVSGSEVFVAAGLGDMQVLAVQCAPDIPVFLYSFNLEADSGTISIEWSISGDSNSMEFRLVANNETVQWDVSFQQDSLGLFRAEDQSDHARDGGHISYSLMVETGDGYWQSLGMESVYAEVPVVMTQLFVPVPNPFNPLTSISFECLGAGQVDLSVYNLAGMMVASLVHEWMDAGRHVRSWDGVDMRGEPVAFGQYFVRLKTQDKTQTQKVMLAK